MEARYSKLRSLFDEKSEFFREVQRETEEQIEQKSRCVSKLTRKGFPVVFGNSSKPFVSDTFLDTVKNSVLTNLTRDFFKTKKEGYCPGCGEWCKRFERAHTIKERPDIAKEALDSVMAKHQEEGSFEMSEFLNGFIQLHRKYPITSICTACHLILDKKIRKEIPRGHLTYEELRKLDYTGARPIDILIEGVGFDGDKYTDVPKSISDLRCVIFQGVATEYLRTVFTSVKVSPTPKQRAISTWTRHEFTGWYDKEEYDNDGAVLYFFIRETSDNVSMKEVLKAIFEDRFKYRYPYRHTLFQFEITIKLKLASGEIVEITNKMQ